MSSKIPKVAKARRLPRRRRRVRHLLLFLIGVAIPVVLCSSSACRVAELRGDDMAPTLRPGDRVLVLTFGYIQKSGPRLEDVVLLRQQDGEGGQVKHMVRRVVALPGDIVQVREGRLVRNGRPIDEPYVWEPMADQWGPQRCPQGHVIVLGDNHNNSTDSHSWRGCDGRPAPLVSVDRLVGKVVFVIFPPERAGWVR